MAAKCRRLASPQRRETKKHCDRSKTGPSCRLVFLDRSGGGASAAKKERNAVAPTGAPSSRLVPFPALFSPSSIVDIICGHRAVEKATLRRRRVKRQNKWRAGESLGRNSLGRKIEYRTRSLALVRRRRHSLAWCARSAPLFLVALRPSLTLWMSTVSSSRWP